MNAPNNPLTEKMNKAILEAQQPARLKAAKMKDQIAQAVLTPRKNLFGEFLKEEQVAIGVGGTGVGKSVLGVQAADTIAGGPGQYGLQCEAPPQLVIYTDFENKVRDHKERNPEYQISEKVYRVTMTLGDDKLPSMHDFFKDLRVLLTSGPTKGCKVVILDNMTFLVEMPSQERDQHQAANVFWHYVTGLNKELGVAFLVFAHRNKREENPTMDLASIRGSSVNSFWVDSAFGIAQFADSDEGPPAENEPKRVYLKQFPKRGPITWTARNVLTGVMEFRNGRLQITTSTEHMTEKIALAGSNNKTPQQAVFDYLVENPKASYQKIADAVGSNKSSVHRMVTDNNLKEKAEQRRKELDNQLTLDEEHEIPPSKVA